MATDVEIELVEHSTLVCNIFIVNMLRRAPHVHRDFEMCLLLDRDIDVCKVNSMPPVAAYVLLPQSPPQERGRRVPPWSVSSPSGRIEPQSGEATCCRLGVSRGCLHLQKGDVWVMNPFQIHALNALTPAPILAIQFSPAFFSQFWPEASNMRFMQNVISALRVPPLDEAPCCRLSVSRDGNASGLMSSSDERDYKVNEVRNVMIQTARIFFNNDTWRTLLLAEHIIRLFRMTAAALPHRIAAEKELLADKTRSKRVSRLTEYIDANCTRKLLLKEIAEKEGLSMAHLSHFFSSAFGMPFQEYLARVRCEKAHLMMKEQSALDLFDVSVSCGFSDMKYFRMR